MQTDLLLLVGVAALALGSISMLTVRLTSPNLEGASWLSAAFAAGSAGVACLLLRWYPFCVIVGFDTMVLLSLLLLHIGVLRVTRDSRISLWHGGGLLGLQLAVDILYLSRALAASSRTAVFMFLVGLQSCFTGFVLLKLARRRLRAPATYTSVLLLSFSAFSLLCSAIALFPHVLPWLQARLSLLTVLLFLAATLGAAFGFFWIITANLTAEVEHMASTDPLTRLYNRRVFLKWCERELLRSQRTGAPFSLLMVDLDHFKQINDTHGHQRGDEALCAVVERMQDSVRGIDVLCRWGGEEFAVLLPNAPEGSTYIVAERIRDNVQKMQMFSRRGARDQPVEPLRLTVSIGAATYRDLEDDIANMLLRADRALYRAKESGRNRVLVAG